MRCEAKPMRCMEGMHCPSVSCEMKMSLMVCCPCHHAHAHAPCATHRPERRNQSRIHYTLRVSPVPSPTNPLDRRITTGRAKLIPALFLTNLCLEVFLSLTLSTVVYLCRGLARPTLLRRIAQAHPWTVSDGHGTDGHPRARDSRQYGCRVVRTHPQVDGPLSIPAWPWTDNDDLDAAGRLSTKG